MTVVAYFSLDNVHNNHNLKRSIALTAKLVYTRKHQRTLSLASIDCSHLCSAYRSIFYSYILGFYVLYSMAECVTGQSHNSESCHSQGATTNPCIFSPVLS